jgi:ankyrin repeat protein
MHNNGNENVNALLDNVAIIEKNIKSGLTPLLYATSNRYRDILQFFIKHATYTYLNICCNV